MNFHSPSRQSIKKDQQNLSLIKSERGTELISLAEPNTPEEALKPSGLLTGCRIKPIAHA